MKGTGQNLSEYGGGPDDEGAGTFLEKKNNKGAKTFLAKKMKG